MPSPKELAKALAYRGEIRNTPQNSFLGGVANFLAPVSEFADRDKLPGSIPLLGGMSFADLSGLKGAQSLVNDMSYGTPPIRGASLQTAKVDPRVLDLAGVSGAMIPVGKALGKAALREGARQIETGTGIGRAALDPRQRMFAGEGAKTADHGALKVAKDMKAAGVPDEQIHAKTKWTFAFADGKPRFEIDDSAAKFNMNSDIQNKIDANRLRIAEIKDIKRGSLAAEKTQPDLFPKDLSRARASLQGEANNLQADISGNFGLDDPGGQSAGFRYEHPGLYGAYPEIKERVVVSTGGGKGGDLLGQQYQDRIDINHPAMYEFKTNPKTGYTEYAETPIKAKSVAAHEFQHRIQDAEGFARGGSPQEFKQSGDFSFKQLQDAAILDKTMRARNFNQLEALNRFQELFGRKPAPGAFAALERIGSGKELDMARDSAKLAVDPYESYRRLAGEAEARLTQSRMNMTPAERAASYPPSMFDVPVKDQIVRYGDNVGGAMMQRPKTEFEILHDTAQRNAALPKEQGGLGLPANNTYIDRANVMYPTDAYHGGNSLIKEADYNYSGKGKDQYGSAALYTGSDPSIANSHVNQIESGGNVMPLRINREGHVEHDKAGNLTASQIKNLIKASPDEYALSNFGDVEYEGANKVLGNAVNSYKDVGDGELLTQMNMINNDFYTGHPQKFNEKISELTGIKGLNVDVGGGNQFYLSYKPENIRSRFAAFDPMRRHEADILAGVGVGGMLDPQAIAEALRQQDRK